MSQGISLCRSKIRFEKFRYPIVIATRSRFFLLLAQISLRAEMPVRAFRHDIKIN